MTRLWIANLGAERDWCLEATGRRALPPGLAWPDPAELAPRAALLALLAAPGDRIAAPGLEGVRLGARLLETGVRVATWRELGLARGERIAPWAPTAALAARFGGDPAAAARARELNDRGGLARELVDDDRVVVRDLPELRRVLEARAGDRPWVVKARWSAAGRLRRRGSGAELDPDAVRHLERLFGLAGALVFEVWRPAAREWGAAGRMREGEVVRLDLHRAESASGAPAALRALGKEDGDASDAAARERARALLPRLTAALRSAGHDGPFGFDLRLAMEDGREHWTVPADLNVRHTFGHVLHALDGGEGRARLCLAAGAREEEGEVLASDPGRPEATVRWRREDRCVTAGLPAARPC
ncbi:MAG: hypothetical protein R3F20_12915 [Planctomycetota bacterium]